MFDKLADFIIKKHKAILVIWIFILALSTPFITRMGEIITYEDKNDLPKDAESERARVLISERFSDSVSNSSIIVVIKSDNVTDEKSRDFALILKERSENLEGILEYTSIYDAYEQAINYSASLIHPNLYSTEKNALELAQLMYASPYAYTQAYMYIRPNVNSTASAIFGVPSAYLGAWSAIYQQMPTMPIEMINEMAYQNAYDTMTNGTNETEKMFISAYLNAFNSTWTQTFNYSNVLFLPNETSPIDRASFVTNITAPMIFGFEPADSEEKEFLKTVFLNFTITTWTNDTEQELLACRLANSTSWSQIVSNMANLPQEQIQVISAYHNSFNNCYLGSLTQISEIPSTGITPEERAKHCIDSIAPIFFGFDASKPEQSTRESQFAYEVWKSFEIEDFANKSKAHTIAINTIAKSSNLDVNFLEKIYDLGENPKDDTYSQFSHSIIENGTIWTYPVQIPKRYVEKMVSKENDLMMILIEFSLDSSDDIMKENVKELRKIVSELKNELNNNGKKIQAYVTGSAAISVDTEAKSITDMLIIEPVTIALIFLFISLFFLSIVTPFIPLVNAGIGLLVSQAVIFIIGSTFLEIHYLIVFILFAMILAVGSDYSIFIISRYREERVNGKSREEAVRTSMIWAGESIATSGMTVIIGAGALVFMNFSIARMLGIAFMLGVGIALAVNLTFLPSMILLLGNRIFWPSRDKWKGGSKFAEEYKKKKARHEGYFSKSARFSIKHSKAIVLACLLVTVPSMYAISSFEISFDFISLMPKSESKAGMNAMSEGFGAGNIMPTYVVIELQNEIRYKVGNDTEYNLTLIDTLERFSYELEDIDNVASVSGPSRPNGYALNFSNKNEIEQYQADIDRTIGIDNKTVILTVVLNKEPMEKKSVDTIPLLREKISSLKSKESELKDAKILVGGETANMKDLQDMTMKDFSAVVVFVMVGIFIVLVVVLRSIMIPLRLILTILLSISWSLALTMFIFQTILGYPIIWLLPIILFSILMGLGMDYDIYLCTRIREEYLKSGDDEKSIVTAVEETGGIITICGAIMVGAVGSLVLSGLGLLQEFGFAIGFAILVDATIVRIYLVPAIMVLLKKWNWWMPGGIQRVKTDVKTGTITEPKPIDENDSEKKTEPNVQPSIQPETKSSQCENKEINK